MKELIPKPSYILVERPNSSPLRRVNLEKHFKGSKSLKLLYAEGRDIERGSLARIAYAIPQEGIWVEPMNGLRMDFDKLTFYYSDIADVANGDKGVERYLKRIRKSVAFFAGSRMYPR